MILVFRENDGKNGARLTLGEKEIPDGSFLYRDGRYIRGGELGTIPAFTAHRHAGETLKHVGVNSASIAFAFDTQGRVTFNQTITAASDSKFGNLTFADGSITDSSGAIVFGDENLSTTGNISILSNTSAVIFGVGSNAKIGYDNIDLNFDSRLVGAGNFNFKNGNVVLDTGYVDSKAYYYINNEKVLSIDGTGNLHLGINAGIATTGAYNLSAGDSALRFNTTGGSNVALGAYCMYLSNSSNNIGIGVNSLYRNSGTKNVALGFESLLNNTSGSYNFSLGSQTLYTNISGSFNVGVSVYSLYYNATGSRNLAMGYSSGFSSVGDGNIYLGYQSGYYETGSNKFFVDNNKRGSEAAGRISSLIYGEMSTTVANQILRFNATVQLYQDNLFMKFGAGGDSGLRDTGAYMHFDCDLQSATGRHFQFDNGSLLITNISSGATQAAAGASANELWKTSSHATLPDNVVMIGV